MIRLLVRLNPIGWFAEWCACRTMNRLLAARHAEVEAFRAAVDAFGFEIEKVGLEIEKIEKVRRRVRAGTGS
jgi:hypothetical protein